MMEGSLTPSVQPASPDRRQRSERMDALSSAAAVPSGTARPNRFRRRSRRSRIHRKTPQPTLPAERYRPRPDAALMFESTRHIASKRLDVDSRSGRFVELDLAQAYRFVPRPIRIARNGGARLELHQRLVQIVSDASHGEIRPVLICVVVKRPVKNPVSAIAIPGQYIPRKIEKLPILHYLKPAFGSLLRHSAFSMMHPCPDASCCHLLFGCLNRDHLKPPNIIHQPHCSARSYISTNPLS